MPAWSLQLALVGVAAAVVVAPVVGLMGHAPPALELPVGCLHSPVHPSRHAVAVVEAGVGAGVAVPPASCSASTQPPETDAPPPP